MRSADPYLLDLMPRLFAGRGALRVVVQAGAPAPTVLQWWAVPSAGRARLLVPVGRPEGAVMLRRHGGGARSGVRALVATAVRYGVAQRLPLPRIQLELPAAGADGLDRWLARLLGRPVSVGVLLGPPRPNRKPVVQVFGTAGEVVAFVKVGADPVTAALVRREAENLELLGGLDLHVVQLPEVLAVTRLGELEILVLSPLTSSQEAGRTAVTVPPLAAMAEVAASRGTTTEALAGSAFWVAARDGADSVLDPSVRRRLRRVVAEVDQRHGTTEVVMGSWHGDWAPWNMGLHQDRVQVWDWERFAADVPWGLDLVHFLAQQVKVGSARQAEQQRAFLQAVPDGVRAMGPHGATQDPALLLLAYLVTICLRFSDPSATTAGGAAFPRVLWALDTAEALLGPW